MGPGSVNLTQPPEVLRSSISRICSTSATASSITASVRRRENFASPPPTIDALEPETVTPWFMLEVSSSGMAVSPDPESVPQPAAKPPSSIAGSKIFQCRKAAIIIRQIVP